MKKHMTHLVSLHLLRSTIKGSHGVLSIGSVNEDGFAESHCRSGVR